MKIDLCQAVTSVLCLLFRPRTEHCSTKNAYTSEITFLALVPCNKSNNCFFLNIDWLSVDYTKIYPLIYLPPNLRKFKKRKIHQLPSKDWDFRDDCTEFIPSVMFMIRYHCNHVSFFDKSINKPIKDYIQAKRVNLKEVFAKNERGYRHTAKNKRFWSLLILLLSVVSIRRKSLKTTYMLNNVASTQIEKVAIHN